MTQPGSGGQINSSGTLHDLHRDSADAYFMHGAAPGSAQSAGTMHDLHPGYRPDHGYSPPNSHVHPSMNQNFGHQGPSGQRVGKLSVRIIAAFDLKNTDLGVVPGELSDPFCVIRLGDQEYKTDVVRNNLNPVFNSPSFEFSVPNEDDTLRIEVFNASQFYAHDTLGKINLSLWHIVTNPGVVIPTTVPLEDGGRGRLEYEVYYLPAERMGTMAGKGKDPPRGQTLPFVELQVQRKPVQHMVPLPDFHSFGPAAFVAPPPEAQKATAGEMKRKAEYESWACHMGQYDYEVTKDREGNLSTAPVYFPSQEPTDRHAWKQDPFYRALDDTDRSLMEGGTAENKDPFQKWITRDAHEHAAGKCTKCGNTLMSDARFCRKCGLERSQNFYRGVEDKAGRMEIWQKDPFSDWLRDTKFTHDGMRSDQLQEARLERKMLALPSFKDDVKRFGDNRDYANLQDVAQNCRPRHDQDRYKKNQNKERLWQEDAFYDWLPDHGGGDKHMQKHTLHPPLENARMARLPSFSEDRFLGLQGKGIGVLKVWVKHAMNLRCQLGTGKWIESPSACVLISCGGRGQIANSSVMKGKKPTPTIENSSNPVWNAGPFQFEVMDEATDLTLEVMDLLGQAGESELFLGRVVRSVRELHGHEIGVKTGVKTEVLDMGIGSDKGHSGYDAARPQLSFEVLFQPYNKSFDQQLQRPLQSISDQRQPQGCIGQITVHRIRATGSSGQNGGGLFSSFTKSGFQASGTIVKSKLLSDPDSKSHVTDRCKDADNPTWDLREQRYTFNVQQSNDFLEFSVYADAQDRDAIGILRVPVDHLLRVADGSTFPIADTLKDIKSGQDISGDIKMEVTISVRPGDHSAAAPYHRSISQGSQGHDSGAQQYGSQGSHSPSRQRG